MPASVSTSVGPMAETVSLEYLSMQSHKYSHLHILAFSHYIFSVDKAWYILHFKVIKGIHKHCHIYVFVC